MAKICRLCGELLDSTGRDESGRSHCFGVGIFHEPMENNEAFESYLETNQFGEYVEHEEIGEDPTGNDWRL